MPYFERVITAGEVVEVQKFYSARLGKKGGSRRKWEEETPEKVLAVNEKKAIDKLRWLMFENFKKGDGHIILTYRKRLEPEEAKKALDSFTRKMRRKSGKLGKEFKYISVTEYQGKRIHHHMIAEKELFDLIAQVWEENGAARVTYITGYEHMAKLAEYFVKETRKTFREKGSPYRKRWNASSNLKRWKEETRKVSSNSWRKQPKETRKIRGKRYYLDQTVGDGAGVLNYECTFTGLPCQFYRLYPLELKEKQKRKSMKKKE